VSHAQAQPAAAFHVSTDIFMVQAASLIVHPATSKTTKVYSALLVRQAVLSVSMTRPIVLNAKATITPSIIHALALVPPNIIPTPHSTSAFHAQDCAILA
jgi:hypothetical protein